jgi:hypothetical protein
MSLGCCFFVEKDVALGPIDVSLFGTEGIVLQANRIAYLIENLSGLRGGFYLCRDRKITHGCARDCYVQFSNKKPVKPWQSRLAEKLLPNTS